jgi:hypothetical protein
MRLDTNGEERLHISSSGNVGIGVSPAAISNYRVLQTQGTNGTVFDLGASGKYSRIISDTNGLGFEVTAGSHANQNIRWKAGTISGATDSHMILNSSGNVGIGIVPPTNSINSKLNVQHALTAAYSGSSFNGSTVLRLNNNNVVNNYVGIGFTHEGGTEGFLGWVRRGSADVADFVFQGYDGSVNGYKELARINNTGMTSTQSIGYSLNSLIEPTTVSTSRTGGSGGDCFFDYILDSNNSAWSTFNIFLTVSTVSGGAAGDAGAWYMIAGRHYGGNMGTSVRDSGGNTSSFTVAVSDQGGTDPISVRLAITGMQATSVATATLSNVYGVVSVS